MTSQIAAGLFVVLPDQGAAEAFGTTVQAILASFGDILETGAKRYWKVPEWFEVVVVLRLVTEPHSTFADILSSLGQGCQRSNTTAEERSAVWNSGPDANFYSPIVRWANVELFPESAIGSP